MINITKQKNYSTGAKRDDDDGKPRFELLECYEVDARYAAHMARGAEHYGDHNWQKGIPSSRYFASLLRHVKQLVEINTAVRVLLERTLLLQLGQLRVGHHVVRHDCARA